MTKAVSIFRPVFRQCIVISKWCSQVKMALLNLWRSRRTCFPSLFSCSCIVFEGDMLQQSTRNKKRNPQQQRWQCQKKSKQTFFDARSSVISPAKTFCMSMFAIWICPTRIFRLKMWKFNKFIKYKFKPEAMLQKHQPNTFYGFTWAMELDGQAKRKKRKCAFIFCCLCDAASPGERNNRGCRYSCMCICLSIEFQSSLGFSWNFSRNVIPCVKGMGIKEFDAAYANSIHFLFKQKLSLDNKINIRFTRWNILCQNIQIKYMRHSFAPTEWWM